MSFKFFATILVASALCASSIPVAVEQTLIGKRFSGQVCYPERNTFILAYYICFTRVPGLMLDAVFAHTYP